MLQNIVADNRWYFLKYFLFTSAMKVYNPLETAYRSYNFKNMKNTNSIVSKPKKYIIPDGIEMSEVKPVEMNRGLALTFLQVLFTYGQLSTGFSYGLEGFISIHEKLQYYVKRHRIRGILSRLIYILLCNHEAFVVINYDFNNVSVSKLVNWIKRITYAIFAAKLIIMLICLERGGRKRGTWIQILEQADVIQEKFATFGIYAPSRVKVKVLGCVICIVSFLLCFIHMLVFSIMKSSNSGDWIKKYARCIASTLSFNLWKLDTKSSNQTLVTFLGYLGLITGTLCWNMWYVCDALRVFSSLIVWMVFRTLNCALVSGKLTMNNLPDIMDLHFKGIKLLNLFNQLMAPITFASTLFNMVYICFWTNYALISFEFKLSHLVGMLFVIRMLAVFYITADVNTQAHQISTWLENGFSETHNPPQVDKTKLVLFTSLIYNRDVIGFKGLNFFTITPALNSAIAGLVLTYTVVVNQFATH